MDEIVEAARVVVSVLERRTDGGVGHTPRKSEMDEIVQTANRRQELPASGA